MAEVDCIFCGGKVHKSSKPIRSDGSRPQKYQCQECGRYFLDSYAAEYSVSDIKVNEFTVVEV